MEYQLIVKMPFIAIDDLEARQKAKGLLAKVPALDNDSSEIKLQKVFQDKPPMKVDLKR